MKVEHERYDCFMVADRDGTVHLVWEGFSHTLCGRSAIGWLVLSQHTPTPTQITCGGCIDRLHQASEAVDDVIETSAREFREALRGKQGGTFSMVHEDERPDPPNCRCELPMGLRPFGLFGFADEERVRALPLFKEWDTLCREIRREIRESLE